MVCGHGEEEARSGDGYSGTQKAQMREAEFAGGGGGTAGWRAQESEPFPALMGMETRTQVLSRFSYVAHFFSLVPGLQR